MKNPSIDDKSAQKWGKFLIPNVQQKCSDIFGKFGCPEAPELGSPWWPSSDHIQLKNEIQFAFITLREFSKVTIIFANY